MKNKAYFSCSYSLLGINVTHHDQHLYFFFPEVGVHVFPKFQSIIVQIIQFIVLCLYLVEFIIFFTASLFHKYYIMFIIISHQSTIVYKKENVGKKLYYKYI